MGMVHNIIFFQVFLEIYHGYKDCKKKKTQ